jgi:arylsulfatase A-like enzyme
MIRLKPKLARNLQARCIQALIGVLCLGGPALAGPSLQDLAEDTSDASKPSMLLIVVDDWAYSDWQFTRQDDWAWNDLPVIDSLAERGQSWTQFYTQPICNLTRLGLIFGRYASTTASAVCAPPNARTPPGTTLTIANNLKRLGYSTAAFGKWHVGAQSEQGRALGDGCGSLWL